MKVWWEEEVKKRALVAIGHKILVAAYFILKDKTAYKELGGDYLDNRKKDRQIQMHLDKLKELGVKLNKEMVA